VRIRSTKPEFWRSKTIAQLDWSTRLVLKGLESYVDDNGVGKDDLALIAADVFPRDLSSSPIETLRQLTEAIHVIAEAGLIARYEVNGEALIYIDRWKEQQYIQHPKAGRFRRPDGTLEYTEVVSPASYRKPPANCMTGSGDQGIRGTEEKDDDAAIEPPPDDPEPEVVVTPPAYIETSTRAEEPTDSVRLVVRQVLGSAGYPRTTLKRLAVAAGKLYREGHPDALIRESLLEWDRRDSCTRPEYLATVLGDVVKKSRAAPGNNGRAPHKLRTLAELAQQERAKEQTQLHAVPSSKALE
jgi:hypothetical protein